MNILKEIKSLESFDDNDHAVVDSISLESFKTTINSLINNVKNGKKPKLTNEKDYIKISNMLKNTYANKHWLDKRVFPDSDITAKNVFKNASLKEVMDTGRKTATDLGSFFAAANKSVSSFINNLDKFSHYVNDKDFDEEDLIEEIREIENSSINYKFPETEKTAGLDTYKGPALTKDQVYQAAVIVIKIIDSFDFSFIKRLSQMESKYSKISSDKTGVAEALSNAYSSAISDYHEDDSSGREFFNHVSNTVTSLTSLIDASVM